MLFQPLEYDSTYEVEREERGRIRKEKVEMEREGGRERGRVRG